ncbi:Ig-like domain-containing protein, partial [Candidatus Pantoea multigeneris]
TKSASLGAITEKGNGLYEVTLTTGTRSSLAVITASLDDVRLPLASVKQIADRASASLNKGELTLVNTAPVVANGKSEAQASARVLDGNNNPVPGVAVTFTLGGSARPIGALVVKTDSKGIALLKFTNTVAEKVTVTGKVGSGTPQSVEATFIAESSSASLNKGDLKLVNTGPVVANGTSQAQASARVLDGNNNPVAGVDVTFTLNGAAKPVGGTLVVKTDSKGIALLKFTNTVAEKVTVTGKVGSGTPQSVEATFIVDRSSANLNKGELKLVNTAPGVANGKSEVQTSARVLDGNNNPVPDMDVTFTLGGSARPVGGALVVKTDSKGIALLKFTNTVAEKVKVTGKVGSGTPQSVEATFIGDKATAQIAAKDIKPSKSAFNAYGSDSVVYTVIVKDALGHPVPNLEVKWSDNPFGTTLTEQTRTNSRGEATVKMASRFSGEAKSNSAIIYVAIEGSQKKIAAPPVVMKRFTLKYPGNLNASAFQSHFKNTDDISIVTLNETRNLYPPQANQVKKGVAIRVTAQGLAGTYVHANGKQYFIKYNTGHFVSDGKSWIYKNTGPID